MNINRIPHTQRIQSTESRQTTDSARENVIKGSGVPEKSSGTKVSLGSRTRRFSTSDSHDINYSRLAEIQSRIDAGEYHPDSDHIARALVNEILRQS